MKYLRLKSSIHLNREDAISEQELIDLKHVIERAAASLLPNWVTVDMIKVTSLKEAKLRG